MSERMEILLSLGCVGPRRWCEAVLRPWVSYGTGSQRHLQVGGVGLLVATVLPVEGGWWWTLPLSQDEALSGELPGVSGAQAQAVADAALPQLWERLTTAGRLRLRREGDCDGNDDCDAEPEQASVAGDPPDSSVLATTVNTSECDDDDCDGFHGVELLLWWGKLRQLAFSFMEPLAMRASG